MVVVNDWGGVAKVAVIEYDGGVAEMAVNGTAAATVEQGQAPSGATKAAAGATPMDDENLCEMLRATNHRRHLWAAISGECWSKSMMNKE
jgi:hypothetical protein